jgi:hypothetical protein
MAIKCFIATEEDIKSSMKGVETVEEGEDLFDLIKNIDPWKGLVDVSKEKIPQWQLDAFIRAGESHW